MPSIGKFIRHQSQYNDKFQVSLQIHTAFGVNEKSSTAQYFVSYRRGDHKGSSMKVNITSPRTITFDQTCSFSLPCTLYYCDVNKKDYEDKHLTVMFNEETSAEPPEFTTHGKATINLAKYAKEVPQNSTKSFPLTEVLGKKKKGEALMLQVTLTMKCIAVCEAPKEEQPEPEAETSVPPSANPTKTSSLSSLPSLPSSAYNTPINSPPQSAPIFIPSSTPTSAFLTSASSLRNNSAPDNPGSAPSISGLSSLSAPARTKGDDSSVSSYSSRNSRNSAHSSPSSSPPSSPRNQGSYSNSPNNSFYGSLENEPHDRMVNGNGSNANGNGNGHGNGHGNGSTKGSDSSKRFRSVSGGAEVPKKQAFPSLPASASSSSLCKSYLQSTPAKIHLLERQSSDTNLLNTCDIAKRLASRHPELCKSGSGSKLETVRMDSTSAPRSASPVRRVLDFKNEKVKSMTDLKATSQKAFLQKQKDDEKYLVEEIIPMEPYYSGGIPVLPYVLFRTLLQWRSFNPNNTHFLHSIISALNNMEGVDHASYVEVVLYRLSSAATLLHILNKELQILSNDNINSVLKDFEKRLKKSLLSFYDMYYNIVKEDLDAPITSVLATVKIDGASSEELTTVLEKHLKLIRKTMFFEALQQKITFQVFYYINGRILNSLLQRTTPSHCSVGLGLKMVIINIENWAAHHGSLQKSSSGSVIQLQCDAVTGWVHSVSHRALSNARQAADVLVVTKSTLVEAKIREEVCPSITPQQLLTLLEGYVPDDFDPEPIHPGVLKHISGIAVDNKSTADPPSVLIEVAKPLSIDIHFEQPLPLDSIVVPSAFTDNSSFAFLRDACSSDKDGPW